MTEARAESKFFEQKDLGSIICFAAIFLYNFAQVFALFQSHSVGLR